MADQQIHQTDHWRELAWRVSADQRQQTARADQAWRDLDLTNAAHLRGVADGLGRARDHQLAVTRDQPRASGADPLDAAIHAVWLHGDWLLLTRFMTTEEREALADGVARHSRVLSEADGSSEPAGEPSGLRWWRA